MTIGIITTCRISCCFYGPLYIVFPPFSNGVSRCVAKSAGFGSIFNDAGCFLQVSSGRVLLFSCQS